MMKNLKITKIEIHPIKPNKGHVGFASITINDSLYIGSIAIYTSVKDPTGYRLVYPDKILPNKEYRVKYCHPTNKEVGDYIKQVVVKEYEKIIG